MELNQVKKWFIKAVQAHKEASPELKRALFSKTSMLNNYLTMLHKELQKCENLMQVKKGKSLKSETYQNFVEEMANAFVKSMEKNANERMQSELKRLAVRAEKDKEKEMQENFSGNLTGEFKELVDEGSLILDESQLQRPGQRV